MDTFARALLAAAKILSDGVIPGAVKERYSSFDQGIGAKIESGNTNFEELEVSVLGVSGTL
jgi:xylose isomerase